MVCLYAQMGKCLLCSLAKENHGLDFWEDVNGLYIISKVVLWMCRMLCSFLGDGSVHPQHTTRSFSSDRAA